MTFSLILATLQRTDDLAHYLASLKAQTFHDFELIIVDQNPDDRLLPILNVFTDSFPIIHLRSRPGLSRARNRGLQHSTGEIYSFPDDDCTYPPNLLKTVYDWFKNRPEVAGLTGRCEDPSGIQSTSQWKNKSGPISRLSVWKSAVSITIFLRAPVLKKIGGFDEQLGVGSGTPWGSGEETDYLLRALEAGFIIHFNPSLVVHHPEPILNFNAKALERAVKYGRGMGRVCRKHRFPLWFITHLLGRTLIATVVSLFQGNTDKARFQWALFRSRFSGWLD